MTAFASRAIAYLGGFFLAVGVGFMVVAVHEDDFDLMVMATAEAGLGVALVVIGDTLAGGCGEERRSK